jgi:hypothetical protein
MTDFKFRGESLLMLSLILGAGTVYKLAFLQRFGGTCCLYH